MRIDIQTNGTTWHEGPVMTAANYRTWESKSIEKSQFSGSPNWANVTGWRLHSVAFPTMGTTYYIKEFKAVQ